MVGTSKNNKDLRTVVSELNNILFLFGEALLGAFRQVVREEIEASQSLNGHEEGDKLLTAQQAGERWNIPPSKIKTMARMGKLPYVRLGHYIRFSPADLARFIEGNKEKPPSK